MESAWLTRSYVQKQSFQTCRKNTQLGGIFRFQILGKKFDSSASVLTCLLATCAEPGSRPVLQPEDG